VRDEALHGGGRNPIYRKRSRLQLTVNQNFRDHGTLFLNVSSR
jgi:outer membrane usher protein